MDNEDDPGAIPAVRHVEYVKEAEAPPPVAPLQRTKDDMSESPFDETIKEEQLKELDDIIAMISSNTSPDSSIAPAQASSPHPLPPPSAPPTFDPLEHHLPFSPIVHPIQEPSPLDDLNAPDDEPMIEAKDDQMSSFGSAGGPSYLPEPIRYTMEDPPLEHQHDEVSDASDGETPTRSPLVTRKATSPSPLLVKQPDPESPDDEGMAVSDEPTLADQAVFTRKSEDDDDRSKVDSIMLIDNDVEDDDDDEDDVEEDDEEIMEEIARECSPVSACLTEVGTMAGEIYNSVEENLKRQDSNAEAEEDNLQKGEAMLAEESEISLVPPNSDAVPQSDETTDADPPQELDHAYATPYDPQEILAYPSEEGSLLQYPTEYDVTHSPLPAVPSLLGEDAYEDEDVEIVDRELDFSNQDMEPETAEVGEKDEVLVLPNVVAGDESEPQSEAEETGDEPSDEDKMLKAERDAEATNSILSSAALSAALLGLGPRISNRLSNVPRDERLAAPEGVDPIDNPIRRSASAEETISSREAYVVGSINDTSRDPKHPEDMVWIHKHPTNEDMNASHDYTVGTAVNESRDDGVSEEEHFIDEEQPPDNSKTRDAFAQSKNPGSWSRKCYILICIGLAVLAIIIAISVVFGTKSASSNATEGPSAGGETRETQFSQLLVGNSLADPSLLSDESSSESKAMKWMIYEDPLALDPTNSSAENELRISQRYSLATLYFASPVGQWANASRWLDNDECEWFGIVCDGDVVNEIDLSENNVTGTISADIAQLSSLVRFVINQNGVKGSIPTSMAKMLNLKVLGLRYNSLDQKLQGFDFSMLTDLEVFDVKENKMLGSIPSSIYSLTALTYLDFNSNRLTGTVSTKIGSLTKLERFVIKGNAFVGSIPSEIGKLKLAKIIDVSGNQLSGPIPTQVNAMTELIVFNAYENKVDGKIPLGFGSLSKLETLELADNLMIGPIPPELGNAIELRELTLDGNILTGTIPSSLGKLVNLKTLSLGDNPFGESLVPTFIYELPDLVELSLQNATLVGPVAAAIGNLDNLETLRLDNNFLNATVPSEMGNLVNLQVLRLELNALTGSLPTYIGQLVKLAELRVHDNLMTGSIPSQIGELVQLTSLTFGRNYFNGAFPRTVSNLVNLQLLTCEDNFLTGTLPANIGNMKELEVFRCHLQRFEDVVTATGLQGQLPSSIGNLKKLKELSLYQNGLTGSIPSALGSCEFLEVLDLELNKFVGVVPSAIGKLPILSILLLGGNSGVTNPLPQSVCSIDTITRYRVDCGLRCTCCTDLCGSRGETLAE